MCGSSIRSGVTFIMAKYKDIAGQRFGALTAICRVDAPNGEHKHAYWLFHCDCGKDAVIVGRYVRMGIRTSCGCSIDNPEKNIVGKKFGKLTAIRHIERAKWLFRCDCGNEIIQKFERVTSGKIKSCGCGRHSNRVDIAGQRFGKLTAKEYIGGGKWHCVCDCGRDAYFNLAQLKQPHIHSCGCWLKEGNANRKHGGRKTLEYSSWMAMKARCYNPKNVGYPNYGGRGIKVCDRWLGEHGFENFLADMGERPSKDHSIDRIDVNSDYCPENCRWATRKQQCNNRRSNLLIEHKGEIRTLTEWCIIFGIDMSLAENRYRRGLLFDEIFSKKRLSDKRRTLNNEEAAIIRNTTLSYAECKAKIGRDFQYSTYRQIRIGKTYKDF